MAIRRIELRNAVAELDLNMSATATKKALRKAEKDASTIEEAVNIVMAEAEFAKVEQYTIFGVSFNKHAEYSKKLQLCCNWLDKHPRCLSGYTL